MTLLQKFVLAAILLTGDASFAQYGTAETLKAELQPGGDLVFSSEAKELSSIANLSNALFAPPHKEGEKLPGLVLLHTCGGISEHIRVWVDAALKMGYVVVPVDTLTARGLRNDCGSPSKVPNGRWIKDALDAVNHLAALPYVNASRISVVGFSKGALAATWLSSPSVAEALGPNTVPVAAVAALYGFCAVGPTKGRPQGIRIVQEDASRPTLILLGRKDTELLPDSCLELLPKLKATGAPMEWHLYPEATHAWDKAEQDGFSKVGSLTRAPVVYRYDKEVAADSRNRVFEFLARVNQGK